MQYQHIRFAEQGGVARLSLNRPQRMNAMHRGLLEEFNDALERCQRGAARALLVAGEGRAFCSGADLSADAWEDGRDSSAEPDAGRMLETHFNPLIERLFALPIPVVTAVNGVAAGAGCSLALAGDIVVAARGAYFLQAFVNIGLVPDMGSTWMLPRLVGRARAQAMMMLGERIPAEQACELGMIYKVVEDNELQSVATDVAERLACGPTVAYGLIRRGLRECMDATFSEALRIERRNQKAAGLTADFAEGVAAFAQKRPAKFRGR